MNTLVIKYRDFMSVQVLIRMCSGCAKKCRMNKSFSNFFFISACHLNVTDRIRDQTTLLLTICWLMNSNFKEK